MLRGAAAEPEPWEARGRVKEAGSHPGKQWPQKPLSLRPPPGSHPRKMDGAERVLLISVDGSAAPSWSNLIL